MPKTVFCEKLKKTADALQRPPYPGALGLRIYEHISQEAWLMWLQHQTMLINENRLNLLEQKTRAWLENEMKSFLFEDASPPPPGYTPVST